MDAVGDTMFGRPAEREIEVTPTFDVPREVVWAAWTTCEHVPAWSGPEGWELAGCEVDLRPGGTFRFVYKVPGTSRSRAQVPTSRSRRRSGSSPARTTTA